MEPLVRPFGTFEGAERVADKTGASVASEDLGARGRLSPYRIEIIIHKNAIIFLYPWK